MKIYTRTGDTGDTALFGGGRVPKDHPRVDACGAIDELNAFIGRAIGDVKTDGIRRYLTLIQHDLFTLGSHMASPATDGSVAGTALPPLPETRPREMEGWMDEADATLAPLTEFILPGGAPGACALHVCRTVCRRAERSAVGVARGDASAAFCVRYLNRLSDLLFVLARTENRRAGVPDVPWSLESE